MKTSTLIDGGGKSKGRDDEQFISPELSMDPGMIRASLSDDGKSIRITDKAGRKSIVSLPVSTKPFDTRKNPAVRLLAYGSPDICPCCGCLRIVIDGMEIYYDPRTGQLCSHH